MTDADLDTDGIKALVKQLDNVAVAYLPLVSRSDAQLSCTLARVAITTLLAEVEELRKDGKRLDKLDAMRVGYGGWILRMSRHGRGARLHESKQVGAVHPNVRDAIDAYETNEFAWGA